MKSKTPPSFRELVSTFWVKTVFATGIGAFLFVLVFLTVVTHSIQSKNFSYIASNIIASLRPSLQVGDELEVAKRLSAVTSTGAVVAARVDTPDGRVILSAQVPVDEQEWIPDSSSWAWMLPWKGHWLVQRRVEIGEDQPFTISVLHEKEEIADLFVLSLLLAGVLCIVGLGFVSWRSRRLAAAIVRPLQDFTNVVANGSLGDSKPKSIESVLETKELFDVFCDRQQRLEASRAEVLRAESERAKYQAIARTAQMFGHDAKRPFSRFDAAIDFLKSSNNLADFKRRLLKATSDIQYARRSIDGMIVDVMVLDEDRKPVCSDVEPAQLIEDSLRQTVFGSAKMDVGFSFDLRHTMTVSVEAVRIERVLVNVIANAVEAMQPLGRIWFVTEDSGEKVHIKIGNSNSYIPNDELPSVFDSFFTRRKEGGTGLGLAISKKIVEQHGGKISCRSGIEWGTEFILELPMGRSRSEKSDVEMKRDKRVDRQPNTGKKVIVIDDDELVVEAWKNALNGHSVQCFYQPEEFYSWLETDQTDMADVEFIICDYYFDGTRDTGEGMAKAIRERNTDVPILISSDSEVAIPDGNLFNAKIGKNAISAFTILNVILNAETTNGSDLLPSAINSIPKSSHLTQ